MHFQILPIEISDQDQISEIVRQFWGDKPSIPEIGENLIPLRDALHLEKQLQ